jgi:hypothetical protein
VFVDVLKVVYAKKRGQYSHGIEPAEATRINCTHWDILFESHRPSKSTLAFPRTCDNEAFKGRTGSKDAACSESERASESGDNYCETPK